MTGTNNHMGVTTDATGGEETLARYLVRTGRLPLLQGLALAAQLLADLDHAHRCGSRFADISTASVRVSRAGRLLLPAPDRRLRLSRVAGTARELRAAAAVARELLTGGQPSPPIPHGRRFAHGDDPVSVRAMRRELPAALDAVFERALDPGARGYSSATELSAALQAAIPAPDWERAGPASPQVSAAVVEAAAPVLPVGVPRERQARVAVRHRAGVRPVRGSMRAGIAVAAAVVVVGVGLLVFGDVASWTRSPQVRTVADFEPSLSPVVVSGADAMSPPRQPIALPAQAAPARTEGVEGHGEAERHAVHAASTLAARGEDSHAAKSGRAPAARKARRADSGAAVKLAPALRGAVASAGYSLRPGPYDACRLDVAAAVELCVALKCATSDFRQHPVCVRMHAEGARARARMAEAMGGP